MILHPKLLFISLLLALPLQLLLAINSTYSENKDPRQQTEYFANGNVKRITITKVKTPRNIDLFNLYKQTKVISTEFDSITGKVIMHSRRITKIGVGGKHCYEISSLKIDYDVDGNRKHYEYAKCDKHYYIVKEYQNGKVAFTHIEKKRIRRW
ncbi:hypothetical protein BH09BAC5_BH09BAC5_02800 [soil metagenome]